MRPPVPGATAAVCVCAAVLACVRLPAQDGSADARTSRSVQAVRVPEGVAPPRIDGRLDDPVWDTAGRIPASEFRQAAPVGNSEASDPTEAWFLFDERNLYVAFVCYDSEPDRITATRMSRDARLFADDRVTIWFDTFHQGRDGYRYEFNASGARTDALLRTGQSAVTEWDGVFLSRAGRIPDGWVVEFLLPFQSVAFDPNNDTWGMNIERVIRRRSETIRWSTPLLDRQGSDLGIAGDLTGLVGLQQGLGLDVVPYGLVELRNDRMDGSEQFEGDAGLDVRYRITPSLTGVLTVNTDFAATEVDDRQVNLTRFPLFFPEKRDFFLQDSGLFEFGGRSRDLLPFFSRRVGIDSGQPVDLLVGGKVTGRVEGVNVGLLSIQQDGFDDVDPSTLSVGRLSFDVLEESRVGVIGTVGNPSGNTDNALWGADFSFVDNDFFGDEALRGNAWFQQSIDEVEGEGSAYGVDLSYPNDRIRWSVAFREVRSDFRPALGFVRRRAIRGYDASWRYRWRPDSMSGDPYELLTIESGASASYVTNLDDQLESGALSLDVVTVSNRIGDRVGLDVTLQSEELFEPFEIADGVVLPEGRYDFPRYRMFFNSASARPVGYDLSVTLGEFFSGTRSTVSTAMQLRPSDRFTAEIEYEYNAVELDEGTFDTHVARVPFTVFFSPRTTLAVFTQYDNISDALSTQARLRHIVQDGNEFFAVLNQGWLTGNGRFDAESSDLVLKLTWTFRF